MTMEKAEWQERPRRHRPHRHERANFLGVKKDIILAVLVAVITTFFLSSQWHAPPPYHEHAHYNHQINAEDLEYGLAQCALNQQRPFVDYNLATTRLAARSSASNRTILHNATLINGDGSVTHDAVIEIQDGIFTSVTSGSLSSLEPVSSGDKVLDLHGRIVTPGLVDMHSHAGVRETPQLWATEDVTEISAPVTPWARAIDAFKPHDGAIPVIASGGVTTSLVLTGAKNQISGEGVVVKMKRADSVLGMLLDGGKSTSSGKPQRYLKMAMGENQKRQFENVPGGPSTRLGESYWFRKAYDTAARLKHEQDLWCEAAMSKHGLASLGHAYPRSLEWQTLVDVLRGDVRVNVHGYETEDVLAMFDHADEFGFNITALHHALHSDLVMDQIKARDIAVVGFADTWGDKKELYSVRSNLSARVANYGIPFVLTRDHPAVHGQWLVYEAQIAHHYGLGAEDAVKSIIGHPARLIGLDNRLGFVRPGYDADLVVWDRHLLQVGATPLEVYIDGKSVARASESLWETSKSPSFGREAPVSRSDDIPQNSCELGQSDVVIRGLKMSFIGDDGIRSEQPETGNLTVVVREGSVVCVGGSKCADSAKQAVEDSVPSIDLQDGYMLPGLTIVTRQHGLTEMRQEPSTADGASEGEEYAKPLSSRFGIKFDGIHVGRAYRSGVTRIVTPPLTTGFFHGISTMFRSGAKSVLDDGAIAEPNAALHFTIGHHAKSPQTPSITSQISKLHDLLTVDKHIHPIYESAAKGDIAVFVHTDNKDVIAHMVALKQETGAHIVIMGGSEAHLIASELAEADVPVIVAPFWGCEPLFWDSRNCLPGPPLTDRLGPQVLIDAGVKVGISNWGDSNNHIRNSIWEASWVAGPGNRSLALDLVSKNIDHILQIPHSRDFVVYEGDPFNFGARVALIFEEGEVRSCYPNVDELV